MSKCIWINDMVQSSESRHESANMQGEGESIHNTWDLHNVFLNQGDLRLGTLRILDLHRC